MPRRPRFYPPGIPVHIVQRGHSREPVFFEPGDYQAYLHWLQEDSERYACDIRAYVLMTNHIHVLATAKKKSSISLIMQYIGRRDVPYINHSYGTSGTIWPLQRLPATALMHTDVRMPRERKIGSRSLNSIDATWGNGKTSLDRIPRRDLPLSNISIQ